MYKLVILFALVFTTTLFAEDKYSPFIVKQIALIEQMNESNITKIKIDKVLELQKQNYEEAIDTVMSMKDKFINNTYLYDDEIYGLQKIIRINKRAGNTYAVLRDEIQISSYKLLNNQNLMIKDILLALDYSDAKQFEKELNEKVVQNQLNNTELLQKDYSSLLDTEHTSTTFESAKVNLKEFNALIEINQDVVNYLYIFEAKMYGLNRYSTYNLITPILYINSLSIVKTVNPYLEKIGLNVIKLLIMISLIVLIYFLRKVVFLTIESLILDIEVLKKYSKNILEAIRRPIHIVISIIAINMIVSVYNDFSSLEILSKLFNVIYGFFFTLIVYKISNAVAKIKVHEMDSNNQEVKNEIINVGIKILNFIIMLIGLLIILYLAGVNLTAVLSGLGIGGFAVALAAKDSLANFFGTLSILLSDVFSQGDWIVVDNKEGVVVEIGLRVTTLRTFDNALIAIPNATLANNDVKNWNKRELGRRIKMSLGIKYDSKSDDIKNAVNEIRTMLDQHPEIATENTEYTHNYFQAAKLVSRDDLQGVKKTLLVYLDEFADSSINILIYCFTKSTDWDDWLTTKEDVMHKIMAIFEENNLEFAFPSMSIYNEKDVSKITDLN